MSPRCTAKVGLSNETPWGVMKFVATAEAAAARDGAGVGVRVATIQNAYHLLARGFDAGLAECVPAHPAGC